MLSRFNDFLSRHKRKFIVSGVLVGGTYLALRYAQKKLRDFQEKQVREFIEKTRRMQHFESTEKTCNQITIGISTNLLNEIIKQIDTEDILEKLRGNPDNKIDLWEELKIISFTRLTAFIYATSMLSVTLRVQMNLLGGYLYKDTVADNTKISTDIQQAYLSYIQYFLNEGLVKLIELIKTKVTSTLISFPLTKKLCLSEMEQIFWSIQMAINSEIDEPNSKMVKYVIPQNNNEVGLMEKMYMETLDVLESDDVASLCSNNICRGFSLAIDNIAEFMNESSSDETVKHSHGPKNIVNINQIDMPLAMLIPIISGITTRGFDSTVKPTNLATSLVTSLLVNEKIKTLGANVYEVFAA